MERRRAARDGERPAGKRTIYGTFPQLGAPIGFILANGVFLILATTTSAEDFQSWGWRVPFLAGAVLAIVGLYLSAMAAITFVALLLSPETRDRDFEHNVS